MMDKKTKEFLTKVSLAMPSTIKKALMRTEKTGGTEDLMEKLLGTKEDPKERKAIESGLEAGKYAGKNRFINDPKAARAANEYLEARIKDGMKRGIIKPFEGDGSHQ